MTSTQHPARRFARRATAMFAACAAVAAGLVAYGLSAAGASTAAPAAKTFTFTLKASPGIAACLPHARGQMDPVRKEPVGLLHIPTGPISGSTKEILRGHLHRRVYELKRGAILAELPKQTAEIQRVLPGLVR